MKDKKKRRISTIILIIGGIIIVVIAVILILNATGHGFVGHKSSEEQAAEVMGDDVIPYGDEGADDYDYVGDYFDMSTLKGTMTITKNLNDYNIEITYSEGSDSLTTWTMTASYNKPRRALFYTDCTKMEYVFTNLSTTDTATEAATDTTETQEETEEATGSISEGLEEAEAVAAEAEALAEEASSSVVRTESYTDGSGFLYLSGESMMWVDNKEDMGTGILFQKVETNE